MNYRFKQKISYLLKSRHKGGHGIHSPFLFRLITEVIENNGYYTAYPLLTAVEENVRNMLRILDEESYQRLYDHANCGNSNQIKKLHLLPARFNKLIFRLVNDFKPQSVAFFGSTFGVTLLALAMADRRIPLEAQVENSHYRSFCQRLAEAYEVTNIRLYSQGNITSSDFVVVQNPQNPEYCHEVLAQILHSADYSGVVVLCGIHASAEMEKIWCHHQESPVVRLALDLFDIGIYIGKKGLQKENFVLRF